MRVALITEGTYPYHRSGAGSWCHQLVCGLPRHAYQVVALTTTADATQLAYPLPGNVAQVTAAPVWGPPRAVGGRLARLRVRRAATAAAVLLCRGLLSDDNTFRAGLLRLAQLAGGGTQPLAGTPLADVLTDAWRAARARDAGDLPRLTLGEAQTAAALLEHALRPLAVTVTGADLCHATSGGLPLLVALAARWRAGTPYLLTEQGIYLRERYLDYGGGAVPAAVREVMLRFLRALSRLGYAEAALVAGGSRFDQRWQLRHGAHPARVVVVPAGADPTTFPVRPEPADPVVAWVGRIEPRKDLHTLLRAFRRVHRAMPTARLRLAGPVADASYAHGCQELTNRLGLARVVEFAGPAGHPSDGYAAGQVVARTSVCEGTPYALIEAMLTGRATVSTDVGGVAELAGEAGLVVPPGDPVAVADGLLALLRDPGRRQAMAAAAAARARAELPLDRVLRAYDRLYADVRDADVRDGDGS